jgi:hypothetical protein
LRNLQTGLLAGNIRPFRRLETQNAGATGTPALFINGRFVNGLVPFEEITAVIDDELRRLQGGD